MLRAPVLPRFAELFADHLVYQIDDQPQRTAARLRARSYSQSELAARLDDNGAEAAAGRRLAHRVFRNDRPLGELVDEVAAAVVSDCRGQADHASPPGATAVTQGVTP